MPSARPGTERPITKSNQTRRAAALVLTVAAVCAADPASAQRVDANATAQAEDAFGINVSGENLGLYDPSNIRGFSPTSAGNIRLDGIYIDLQGGLTNRLVNGYRILVGPAVLGHPFPAPTGVVDYGVRRAGTNSILSIAAQADNFGGRQIELDGQLPNVAPGLGLIGGFGLYRYGFGHGGTNHVFSAALSGAWRPTGSIEIVPFFSRIATRDNRPEPVILLAGDALPPPVRTTAYLGQKWMGSDDTAMNYGVLGKVAVGAWLLRASLFRSEDRSELSYTPLFVSTLPSGAAARSVIAERGAFGGATSGELQLSRTFEDGPRRHRLILASWARDQQRRYGATDVASLTPGRIDVADPVAEPAFSFGPQTSDRVRQITVGLAYEGAWNGVGSLNIGVQKTAYRKTVMEPGSGLPASTARPWLFNVAGSIEVTKAFALYAGISRGLEESDVAPEIAVNRNQAPPAIRTSQVDAGARWRIAPHLSLVGDVFQIEKPYYGLDTSRVFRNLGSVRHRGAELSLAGSPVDGLSVVAGGVLLDATVSGDQVAGGFVGRRPVGFSPVKLIASLDYRLPMLKGLSLDADAQRQASRVATLDDVLRLPPRTIVGIGARYRFRLAAKPAVLRVHANNVTDVYSLSIAGSGALQPNPPRQIVAQLKVDV